MKCHHFICLTQDAVEFTGFNKSPKLTKGVKFRLREAFFLISYYLLNVCSLKTLYYKLLKRSEQPVLYKTEAIKPQKQMMKLINTEASFTFTLILKPSVEKGAF